MEQAQLWLKKELKRTHLPTDVEKIIGKKYLFECYHGSHHTILAGVVMGIEASDEGGLQLIVSNPTFWGKRLISIMHTNVGWSAYIDIKDEMPQYSDEQLEKMTDTEHKKKINNSIGSQFFP